MFYEKLLLPALLGSMCVGVTGCSELLGGSDDDDDLNPSGTVYRDDGTVYRDDPRTSRRDNDGVISRDRSEDRYDDGRLTRYPDNGQNVPAGATAVGQMSGNNITYSARQDGKLYLYDNDDRQVIWSDRVRDGDRFVFSPSQGAATLDGQRINLPRLGRGHGFTVYFREE